MNKLKEKLERVIRDKNAYYQNYLGACGAEQVLRQLIDEAEKENKNELV